MGHLLIPLLAILVVIVQTTIAPLVGYAGAGPDLIFLLVMFFALQRGTTLGIWVAFGFGLLKDVANGGPLGLSSLVLVSLAFILGFFRRQLFKENLSAQVLVLLIFTFFYQFLNFFWMNITLDTVYPYGEWLRRGLIMSLYHMLLGPLLFRLLGRWVRGEDVYSHTIPLRAKPSSFI